MALGYIFIMFIVLIGSSIIGSIALFFIKNRKVQNFLFYIMGVFGVAVAYLTAEAQPVNLIIPQVVAWIIGFVGIVGIGIRIIIFRKNRYTPLLCKVLVAISAVLGVVNMFFF